MAHEHGLRSAGCRELFARLSEYMDGELHGDPCEQIEEHLEGCDPCRAFLESLRRTVRLVESVRTPTLPAEVRRQILDAYERLRRAGEA